MTILSEFPFRHYGKEIVAYRLHPGSYYELPN